MKKNGCANCKSSLMITNCSLCKSNLCSDDCLRDHLKKSHPVESKLDSIMDNLNKRRKSLVISPFITLGEMGKDLKNFNNLFDFKNFEFMKIGKKPNVIGTGAFGEVFLAKNKLNGQFFAIKQMNKERILKQGANFDFALREINTHKKLIHDNIIKLHSYHEDKDNFYMIMDYISKGNLYQILRKIKCFDENTAFNYFIQTCSAINFLHSNNLVHRDIKPENLLIDNNNNVKLCDFGWCAELNLGNRVTFCGTYEYMAPEIVNELPYNSSIDIWSLGVLLFELIHGYSPFKGIGNQPQIDYTEVFKNIKKNNLVIDKKVSKNCSDLIKKLLSYEMHDRIKIKDIYSHPWVKSFEESLNEKKLVQSSPDIIIDNRNSYITIARDTNGIKSEPEEMNSRLQNCKEALKSELNKIIKLNKAKEEPNKMIYEANTLTDSSNLIDKVLKKVHLRSKGKFLCNNISQDLKSKNIVSFENSLSLKNDTIEVPKKNVIEEFTLNLLSKKLNYDSNNKAESNDLKKSKLIIDAKQEISTIVNKEKSSYAKLALKKNTFNTKSSFPNYSSINQSKIQNLSKQDTNKSNGVDFILLNNEKPDDNVMSIAHKKESRSIEKINKYRKDPNLKFKDYLTHKSPNSKFDLIGKKNEKTVNLKNNKKEVINQAALEMLDKPDNTTNKYSTQETTSNSFWDNIINFFSPFKCGHN